MVDDPVKRPKLPKSIRGRVLIKGGCELRLYGIFIFSLRTLRDKGFGKSAMETAVLDEVKKFTDLIDKRLEDSESNSTTSSDLNIELGIAVVNSLWSILTGEQIDHGDRRVSDVILGTGKFIRRESMLGALMVYPWLRHLPIFNKQFSHSKNVGPLKMRQLQDDMVAIKKVSFDFITHHLHHQWFFQMTL